MSKSRVMIIGGGFAGLRVLYRLHHVLGDRVDLTLVDERSTSLSKPVLPEVAFAGKPVEHARFPLSRTVLRHGATFVEARVEQINLQQGEVQLTNGRLPYDYLLITAGAI
jgi:sulfide:quinone oxidoreductase